MTTLTHSVPELHEALSELSGARAVVMTMGALHEGHAELMRTARDLVGDGGHVVATVFVNPLQFGAGEDFDAYPRTLEADLAVCERLDVDVLFAPSGSDMYPAGEPQTRVQPGALADELEGASRPGHFAGMLTVVLKLLNLTTPDLALFGEKDYQQLALIRQMVTDFNLPIEIVGVPIVREADGLAMSSRNQYLGHEDRIKARAMPAAIAAGLETQGQNAQRVVEAALAAMLEHAGDADISYVEVRGVDLGPAPARGPARLLLAARIGGVRLLDNAAINLGGQR